MNVVSMSAADTQGLAEPKSRTGTEGTHLRTEHTVPNGPKKKPTPYNLQKVGNNDYLIKTTSPHPNKAALCSESVLQHPVP